MANANLLLEQIKNSIDAMEEQDRLFHAKVKEFEDQGRRIVKGGQIGGGNWEYTDWRTGEVLARGSGDDGEIDDIAKSEQWLNTDGVHNAVEIIEAVMVDGLPESLASDIEAWALEHEQEARAFIARSAAE